MKNSQTNFLEVFFNYSAKIIIIFSLSIIIVASMWKLNKKNEGKSTAIKIILTPTVNPPTLPPEKEINLAGPISCRLETAEGTISAFIKDEKFLVQLPENNKKKTILFKDDCIYIWEEGRYSGEKKCGLKQYLDFFKKLNLLNTIKLDSIIGFLNPLFDQTLTSSQEALIKRVINRCQKEEKINEKIFYLPANILFKAI
ncbi:MAG: hypothetical protein QHH09_01375 [Microgenomates group bacterium]|nr:hypothetical protein [Microgenomates group bacterium]